MCDFVDIYRHKVTFFMPDFCIFAESFRSNTQVARNSFDFLHLWGGEWPQIGRRPQIGTQSQIGTNTKNEGDLATYFLSLKFEQAAMGIIFQNYATY